MYYSVCLVRREVHAHTLDLSIKFMRGNETGIDLLLVSAVTSLLKANFALIGNDDFITVFNPVPGTRVPGIFLRV